MSSLAALTEAVIIAVLDAHDDLAAIPKFPASEESPSLPAPRIVVAAESEEEDDLRIEGRAVRNVSVRIIYTAGPSTTATDINTAVDAIEDSFDAPVSAPAITTALEPFLIFDGITRGETDTAFDTHARTTTTPLTLKALLDS